MTFLRHTKVKVQAIETIFRATAAENSVENHMDYVEANSILQRTVYHLVKKKKKALAEQAGKQLNVSSVTIDTHMVVIKILRANLC